MNATETTMPASLSERLNQKFHCITLRARGPCSIQADDLVLDLSPSLDFREPQRRRLSLSGGLQTTRRPASVRVILSVEGKFHPYCDEANAWCIEDLGMLELGGEIDLDLDPVSTFQLAFADHRQTTVQVPVGEQVLTITLPFGKHRWSCGNQGFAITADPDIPTVALLQTTMPPKPATDPLPDDRRKIRGSILPYMLGGGPHRDPVNISVPLEKCPLGIVRVQCWSNHGLTEKHVLRSTLWALFKARGDHRMLEREIPADWIIPPDTGELHWEAIPVTDKELDTNDIERVRSILSDPLVQSSHFPPESLKLLQAWLAQSETQTR